jgi:dimethylargininase
MAFPQSRSIVALVRAVSPRLQECVLTHLGRTSIDSAVASAQHHRYCRTLADLGARVEFVEPLPAAPDGVFVEDTAIVVEEAAVVCRPGVDSRLAETTSVARALAPYRRLIHLTEAARLEGGDVLQAGRKLYVGRSGRTNDAGIAELAAALEPLGYQVRPLDLDGCLHLKTACTFIPPDLVLANPAWVDVSAFQDVEVETVAAAEPYAANTLTLGGVTLVAAGAVGTARKLAARGVATREVDLSELAKAEGALTCTSVLFAQNGS